MLLTIGMIVKNEEKHLRKCLECIKPILDNVESQLIIADTGSTDGTMAIAKEFTDNVYSIEWRDDFAWARNTTLKRAKGKWYMQLDADEFFEDVSDIISFFNSGEYKKYNCASHLMHDTSATGIGGSVVTIGRLFKRDKNTRFIGKIHEFIQPIAPRKELKSYSVHVGYTLIGEEGKRVRKEKHERNIRPMLEEYEQNPNDLRIIAHIIRQYYFGQEYEKQKEFLDIFEKICPKNDPQYHFMMKSFVNYYVATKQYEKAVEKADEYFSEGGEEHVSAIDVYMLQALSYSKLKREKEEIEANIKALDLLRKYDKGELNLTALSFMAITGIHPESRETVVLRVFWYYLDSGDFDTAMDFIEEYDVKESLILPAYIKSTVKRDIYENVAALYNYLRRRYGIDSKERVMCIKEIEKLVVKTDVKRTFAKALAETGEASDDYIVLNQLRHFYFTQNLETHGLLGYFINSNKFYEPLYADVVYIALRLCVDFSPFISKTPVGWLKLLADILTAVNDDMVSVLAAFVKRNTWLGECKSIKTRRFMYMLAHSILNKASGSSDEVKTIIFELYVNLHGEYLQSVYKDGIFSGTDSEILSEDERFAYHAAASYKLKDSGDYSGFVAGIKTALSIDGSLKDFVVPVLTRLKQDIGGNEPPVSQVERESAALKEAIINLINAGNLDKARRILASYEQINPSDPDIKKLHDMIK